MMKPLIWVALLCLLATPVSAHSKLDTTTPEQGAVLAEVPPHVVLTFAKRIRPTRVRMTHDDRSPVDLDLGDQKTFATRFVVPVTGMPCVAP